MEWKAAEQKEKKVLECCHTLPQTSIAMRRLLQTGKQAHQFIVKLQGSTFMFCCDSCAEKTFHLVSCLQNVILPHFRLPNRVKVADIAEQVAVIHKISWL